jgi:Mrp family chromosome partitioning ATPase
MTERKGKEASGPPVPGSSTSKPINLEMEEEMIVLYQSIDSLRSGTQNQVIQFMGPSEEEGTSTIVREFAIIVASRYSKSVLLLDADERKLGQHPYVNIYLEHSLEETFREGEPIDKAIYQVTNSSLFMSQLFTGPESYRQFLDTTGIDVLLEKLRKRFDLILIDSPPATGFSYGLATSDQVNGVILVLAAEKTSWQVAKNITDRITNHGGKVLGVVFNKQRYHIPKFIYKRL